LADGLKYEVKRIDIGVIFQKYAKLFRRELITAKETSKDFFNIIPQIIRRFKEE
jgi:hypothetical protein